MTTNEDQLQEARNTVAKDTTDLAEELYLQANSRFGHHQWVTAPTPIKRDWIYRAAAVQRDARALLDIEQARLESEARAQAKIAAVDTYRASIATTIPAHRLDTRQNGFLDGWDAALAWVEEQASK